MLLKFSEPHHFIHLKIDSYPYFQVWGSGIKSKCRIVNISSDTKGYSSLRCGSVLFWGEQFFSAALPKHYWELVLYGRVLVERFILPVTHSFRKYSLSFCMRNSGLKGQVWASACSILWASETRLSTKGKKRWIALGWQLHQDSREQQSLWAAFPSIGS